MGNSLRCCLACVLPCGALDVIRIVHLNGHIEELSHPISVKEVINANPNHVLTKPCSQGLGHTILVLSPYSYLKRGHIYFLIPASSFLDKKKTISRKEIKATDFSEKGLDHRLSSNKKKKKKKKMSHRDRGTRRVGVWRPHLERISEEL